MMILRRTFLLGTILASMLPRFAAGQSAPTIIVLGRGITSPIHSYGQVVPRRTMSIEGWLVCNGAPADMILYAELFDAIGKSFGGGDGIRTFNLPLHPLKMRGSNPVWGTAICPSSQLGDAGDLRPFNVDSNI